MCTAGFYIPRCEASGVTRPFIHLKTNPIAEVKWKLKGNPRELENEKSLMDVFSTHQAIYVKSYGNV